MEHLNWGYLHLSLVVLAFGGAAGLVDQPHPEQVKPCPAHERARIPPVSGADLGKAALI